MADHHCHWDEEREHPVRVVDGLPQLAPADVDSDTDQGREGQNAAHADEEGQKTGSRFLAGRVKVAAQEFFHGDAHCLLTHVAVRLFRPLRRRFGLAFSRRAGFRPRWPGSKRPWTP